jgi:hypothetical protein
MFDISSRGCEWRMLLRTVGLYLAATAIRIFSFHPAAVARSMAVADLVEAVDAERVQEPARQKSRETHGA